MIRVGIIGAGFIGRMHFNNYQKLSNKAKVVALCDRDAERRAGQWEGVEGNIELGEGGESSGDIKAYEGYEELLADEEIDLVDICAPTFLHREITEAALQAGKHVLCEKPMALTVEACDAMIEAAEKSSGKFMVGQCVRFWPEYFYLKKAFTNQQFGKLRSLHLRRQASRPGYSKNSWLLKQELSGGMILDMHIHDVDFAYYLLGQPKGIHLQGSYHGEYGVDRVFALWQYEPNIPVVLEGYWDMPASFGFNMGFSAVFEQAAIEWDLASGQPLTVYHNEGEPETPDVGGGDGYANELKYFVECIEKDEKPQISTPHESRQAVLIALAEEESVRTGETVKL
jgi:predicted dehydrogenase